MEKVFIITGTTRGLGEAFVDCIYEESEYKIISLSRKLTDKQKKYSKHRFTSILIDLANSRNFRLIEELHEIITTEEIIFINNAGIINPISYVGTFSNLEIEKSIKTNINATIIICNYLLKEYPMNKMTMINISSGAANYPIKGWSLYNTSKAAIKMFFEVMQLEYPHNNFYNIDPGVINTDMQKVIRSSDFEKVRQFVDYKEKGLLKEPIEVARNILSHYL